MIACDVIAIEVRGTPAPQGSGRSLISGGRAVHVTRTAPLLAWRGAIATEARAAMNGRPLEDGPLAVKLTFRPCTRPASHYLPANSRRPVRVLRPDAPVWHTGTPDADKCARAALDALTSVAYVDDKQAVRLVIEKRWPNEGEAPGVSIRVCRLAVTR